MPIAVVFAALLPSSCLGEEDGLLRFNDPDDAVAVEVTAEAAGDPEDVVAELHSSTGSVVVGSVTVSPGSGPVGTEHQITVEVLDEWQELISVVRVSADAGARGVEVLELVQDSADDGLWVETIVSLGVEGEVRSDRFGVSLFETVPADEVETDTGS